MDADNSVNCGRKRPFAIFSQLIEFFKFRVSYESDDPIRTQLMGAVAWTAALCLTTWIMNHLFAMNYDYGGNIVAN